MLLVMLRKSYRAVPLSVIMHDLSVGVGIALLPQSRYTLIAIAAFGTE